MKTPEAIAQEIVRTNVEWYENCDLDPEWRVDEAGLGRAIRDAIREERKLVEVSRYEMEGYCNAFMNKLMDKGHAQSEAALATFGFEQGFRAACDWLRKRLMGEGDK